MTRQVAEPIRWEIPICDGEIEIIDRGPIGTLRQYDWEFYLSVKGDDIIGLDAATVDSLKTTIAALNKALQAAHAQLAKFQEVQHEDA